MINRNTTRTIFISTLLFLLMFIGFLLYPIISYTVPGLNLLIVITAFILGFLTPQLFYFNSLHSKPLLSQVNGQRKINNTFLFRLQYILASVLVGAGLGNQMGQLIQLGKMDIGGFTLLAIGLGILVGVKLEGFMLKLKKAREF